MTDSILPPVSITPGTKEKLDEVNDQKRADDCMIEVMNVFKKFDCYPVFSLISSSDELSKFSMTAKTNKKEKTI